MEMIKRACTSTLIEKVYMAKLAVLISAPRKLMTHWPASTRDRDERLVLLLCSKDDIAEAVGMGSVRVLQGLVLSDSKTPRSRASCSKVIGMKEPKQHNEIQSSSRWQDLELLYQHHI